MLVSTHSRLKAAGSRITRVPMRVKSFNTQPPEGGWVSASFATQRVGIVSTHSRLKAAGGVGFAGQGVAEGFNTQPPEGGWPLENCSTTEHSGFQHTAA